MQKYKVLSVDPRNPSSLETLGKYLEDGYKVVHSSSTRDYVVYVLVITITQRY